MIKAHPMTGYDPRKGKRWPVRMGGSTGRIGHYGLTRVDGKGRPKKHNGVDWLVENGTRIFACFSGHILNRQRPLEEAGGGGYGKRFYLVSAEDSDTEAIYAHMSVTFVSLDRFIRAGDCIGLTGRSGNMGLDPLTIPNHLHFGVRYKREWVDPLEWLHG